jgi:hypothetical protein
VLTNHGFSPYNYFENAIPVNLQLCIPVEVFMNNPENSIQFLLAVTRSGEDIHLRIDRNSWSGIKNAGMPVSVIKLSACKNADRVFNALVTSIGKPIFYEITNDNNGASVFLEIDFHEDDEPELNCAKVDEFLADYSIDDLKIKSDKLAEMYGTCLVEREFGDYIYDLSRKTLWKMIQKEFETYDQKFEFFGKTNPEKSAILTGEKMAFEKVLDLLGLSEIKGQSIAYQISQVIAHIGSDEVWHQPTYAALVESKVSNLGQTALFPLLDIIKQSNSQKMRDEAIRIIGIIEPEVKEKVLEILQSVY